MKKLLLILALLPTICFGQLKISQLTENPAIDGTEEVPTAKGGLNFKNNYLDLASWILGQSFESTPVTVNAATTAALSGTYNYTDNGGVGDLLTRTTNGAFQTVDGVAEALNNTYLIKNYTGANRKRNGVWQLTQVGTGGTPSILTRATNSDESSELNAQVVIPGGGTTNARRVFSQVTANPTIGTSNIIYTPASAGGGNIRSDGTVDFTATETWDDGNGTTTAISPTGITVDDGNFTTAILTNASLLYGDGTGLTTIQSQAVLNSNGGDLSSQLTPGAISFTDAGGGGASSTLSSSSLFIGNGAYAQGGLSTSSGQSISLSSDTFIRLITANNENIILLPGGTGVVTISLANVPNHADNAAATGAGLTQGTIYRTSTGGTSVLKIVE